MDVEGGKNPKDVLVISIIFILYMIFWCRSAGLARQRSEDSEDLTSSSSTPSKRQSYVKPSSLKKIFDATSGTN